LIPNHARERTNITVTNTTAVIFRRWRAMSRSAACAGSDAGKGRKPSALRALIRRGFVREIRLNYRPNYPFNGSLEIRRAG